MGKSNQETSKLKEDIKETAKYFDTSIEGKAAYHIISVLKSSEQDNKVLETLEKLYLDEKKEDLQAFYEKKLKDALTLLSQKKVAEVSKSLSVLNNSDNFNVIRAEDKDKIFIIDEERTRSGLPSIFAPSVQTDRIKSDLENNKSSYPIQKTFNCGKISITIATGEVKNFTEIVNKLYNALPLDTLVTENMSVAEFRLNFILNILRKMKNVDDSNKENKILKTLFEDLKVQDSRGKEVRFKDSEYYKKIFSTPVSMNKGDKKLLKEAGYKEPSTFIGKAFRKVTGTVGSALTAPLRLALNPRLITAGASVGLAYLAPKLIHNQAVKYSLAYNEEYAINATVNFVAPFIVNRFAQLISGGTRVSNFWSYAPFLLTKAYQNPDLPVKEGMNKMVDITKPYIGMAIDKAKGTYAGKLAGDAINFAEPYTDMIVNIAKTYLSIFKAKK